MRSVLFGAIGAALLGVARVAADRADAGAIGVTSHVVEMRDFVFQPAILEVALGDTVVFVNTDAVPHTATSTDGTWDSAGMRPGVRWLWVATEAGSHEYLCAYHPSMTGSVTVRAGPTATPS